MRQFVNCFVVDSDCVIVVAGAMVCGLPIIVSIRWGCAHDLVIDTKNSFICDPLKPARFTKLLLRFINSNVDKKFKSHPDKN